MTSFEDHLLWSISSEPSAEPQVTTTDGERGGQLTDLCGCSFAVSSTLANVLKPLQQRETVKRLKW